eukprot:Gb_09216 [translate_table: standard]
MPLLSITPYLEIPASAIFMVSSVAVRHPMPMVELGHGPSHPHRRTRAYHLHQTIPLFQHHYASPRAPPSMLAVGAVYTGQCILKKVPSWTKTLKNHTTYAEDQLL